MVGREQLIGVKAAFCAASASIIPFPAIALNVVQCSNASSLMAPHEAEGDYEDFGRSLIAYQSGGSVEGRSWHYVHLVNCGSGETLSVDVMSADGESGSEIALGMIRGIVVSEARYSFGDVRGALVGAGFDAGLTTENKEICACKALYPNDRRGKTPYVFESMFEEMPATNGDEK